MADLRERRRVAVSLWKRVAVSGVPVAVGVEVKKLWRVKSRWHCLGRKLKLQILLIA